MSSFFKKAYGHIRLAPWAFTFFVVALVGTFVGYSASRYTLLRQSADRFAALSSELRMTVTNRINRTTDLPVILASGFKIDSPKADLDAYVATLDLPTRYPSVREVGIYATTGNGQTLRRFYENTISGTTVAISQEEIKKAVTAGSQFTQVREKDPNYVMLIPNGKESYFFAVIDSKDMLSRLFAKDSSMGAVNFAVFDLMDKTFPLYQSGEIVRDNKHSFIKEEQVSAGSSVWVIVVKSNPKDLTQPSARLLTTLVLIFGFIISFGILYLLYVIEKNRARESALSAAIKTSYLSGEEKYQRAVEALQAEIMALKGKDALHLHRIKELERLNKLMVGRELRMVELKSELAKIHEKK